MAWGFVSRLTTPMGLGFGGFPFSLFFFLGGGGGGGGGVKKFEGTPGSAETTVCP